MSAKRGQQGLEAQLRWQSGWYLVWLFVGSKEPWTHSGKFLQDLWYPSFFDLYQRPFQFISCKCSAAKDSIWEETSTFSVPFRSLHQEIRFSGTFIAGSEASAVIHCDAVRYEIESINLQRMLTSKNNTLHGKIQTFHIILNVWDSQCRITLLFADTQPTFQLFCRLVYICFFKFLLLFFFSLARNPSAQWNIRISLALVNNYYKV